MWSDQREAGAKGGVFLGGGIKRDRCGRQRSEKMRHQQKRRNRHVAQRKIWIREESM